MENETSKYNLQEVRVTLGFVVLICLRIALFHLSILFKKCHIRFINGFWNDP